MVKAWRRANLLLAGVSSVITGLLLAGCTDGSSDARALPKGTTETTVSRTPDAERAEALDAYRAMWDDLVVAARTSDAEHPQLDDHANEGALELLRHMMRENKKQGVVTKGQPKFAPVVTEGGATKVVIQDCADGSHWLQYTEDGSLNNDVPGGHHRVDATVGKHKDRWLVESLYIDEVGTCLE
ncbi:hypothetical protein [Streptomyces vastus]|uniref:Secreted protein/lipoprotein n=1 Tax=Streptomyces vastus TaxID=285451 RepID=A0ABN3RUR8_9ACTN